ncbi:nucleotidyltransferase domain-containing protein [Paenibacillus pasadenensis]|uniref:nucleotidyltransferase domain-containing protein n=1 Tax=Paenibacillus pasadenensis TaxID=217090 RepID=UPI00203C7CB9|nr:nucleotidyltransferase domain-containing protein [Paenibacillus pasadenensis]MCM3749249.1 nucleotidyltransferase domain-containing protein [Paenibacillus pasadenensis]
MIDSTMTKKIKAELEQLEHEEEVSILYACESGSRAWGFPSQDSDYDVRFIYVRPVEWYLSVHPGRDVIERPISDSLDLSGWDLRKALQLLAKSNPPLLEWLHSPVNYAEKGTVIAQIRAAAQGMYSSKSCMHHYLNLATGNYRNYLQGDRVRLKKYFYVLRSVLACQWLMEKGGLPPVEFERLTAELLPREGKLSRIIEELLHRKKSGEELDDEPQIPFLQAYLEERLAYFQRIAAGLPSSPGVPDLLLDGWFRKALRESALH